MVCTSSPVAPVYRPRQPRQSPLYRVIERYYPEFERAYDERYAERYGPWRPIVGAVARKFLRCGDLHFGFARVRCADCATKCSSPSPVASAACVPVATRTDLLLAAWQTKVFELLVAAEKIDRQTVDEMRSWATRASASTTASTCRRATLQAWSVWRSTSCVAPSAWPAWSA